MSRKRNNNNKAVGSAEEQVASKSGSGNVKLAKTKKRVQGNRTGGKFEAEAGKLDAYNDASWYAINPQLLKSSASFSYNSAVGTPFRIDRMFSSKDYAKPGNYTSAVPGLMSLETFLTPGVATDAASPVNIAAQNIYSFVRYQNSGSKNYDAPDLMLYLLAMDSIYSYWNFCKRLYGMVNAYSQYNRYMPVAYCNACGVDYEDLTSNLANYRTFLNNTAAKISAFCVPAVMSYFVRHSWMFANIYKDSDSYKAQQYIFVPGGFYQYDETSSSKGGLLKFVPFLAGKSSTDLITVAEIMQIMNDMLNALQYSEDIGVMSGDILKAYGESKLFRLSAVEDSFTVLPVYNEEVLTQIHNMTNIPFNYESDAYTFLNITQDPDTNWIKFDPHFQTFGRAVTTGAMINLPWDDPEPADTMVASRLIALAGPSSTAEQDHFTVLGSEFIGNIKMWGFVTEAVATTPVTYSNLRLTQLPFSSRLYGAVGATYEELALLFAQIAWMSNFDWHPLVYLDARSEAAIDSTQVIAGVMGDINMYTIIANAELETMTLTAIMSEFGIPQFGPVF